MLAQTVFMLALDCILLAQGLRIGGLVEVEFQVILRSGGWQGGTRSRRPLPQHVVPHSPQPQGNEEAERVQFSDLAVP